MLGMRITLPERLLEYVGWRALADAVFSLSLAFLVILLALAIGLNLLNLLRANDVSNLEKGWFDPEFVRNQVAQLHPGDGSISDAGL